MREFKKIIFIPIVLFFIIFASSIVLPGGTYIDISQENATLPIGEIYGNRIVGQSFISEHPNLNGIEIAISNYNRLNTKNLIFRLRTSPKSNDLAIVNLNCEKIFTDKYFRFTFPPIENSKDKSYYFSLESPDSSPGNAITVGYNPENVYHNGSAYIQNNLPLRGDLCFRTVSELDKYDLVRTLLRIIQENLLFFEIWSLLILILIVLLIIISVPIFCNFN